MKRSLVQLRAEIMLIARNGEQLLLTLVIPVVLLSFFGSVDVLPVVGDDPMAFLVPGVIAVAVMSTSMVSLGIATGFERSYLVLKRLGATPLGRGELVAAKVASVFLVELVQLAVLVPIAFLLGWDPRIDLVLLALPAILLGSAAFAGIGLLLAGGLRAELNLAAQNGLYLLLLLLGGMIIPRDSLPAGVGSVSAALPSTALADLLRTSFAGSGRIAGPMLVLAAWAVVAPLVAARRFRWS